MLADGLRVEFRGAGVDDGKVTVSFVVAGTIERPEGVFVVRPVLHRLTLAGEYRGEDMASRKLAIVWTGGRTYGVPGKGKSKAAAAAEIQAAYDALEKAAPALVLHGGAPGADKAAEDWCEANGVAYIEYPYVEHMGKAGGPIRNARMCDDLLKYRDDGYRLGGIAMPGGDGTADCVEQMTKRGIKVWHPASAE